VRTTAALVKLTVFAVVTVLATGLLAATIGNLRFVSSSEYHAVFSDVTGLTEGDDVRVAGVRVGQIEEIAVHGRGDRALVTFSVQDSRPLAQSTQAMVRYRNLVGQRYVALAEGPGDGARLPEGGTIPMAQTQPALDLTVLFDGFKPLFQALDPKDVNRLATEIVKTLQGEGGTINSLLAHTASLTNTLADRDAVIGRTVENLNSVLATLDERDQQLGQLIGELQRFVSGLSADRKAIGASLTNIADLTEATAGLVREGRPAIRSDIEDLGTVARNLDEDREFVDGVLERLPHKLETVTRTATYGSWFNFYVCDFEGRIRVPANLQGKKLEAYTVNYHSTATRCEP
jgi:phospholipid/cholesterol/gamma-HCH transport system substrate-binding protein